MNSPMNSPQPLFAFKYNEKERQIATVTARKARIAHDCLLDAIPSNRPHTPQEVALLAKFRSLEARANAIAAPTLHTPA